MTLHLLTRLGAQSRGVGRSTGGGSTGALPPAVAASASFTSPSSLSTSSNAGLLWSGNASFSFSFWFYTGTIPFFVNGMYLLSQTTALNWSSAVAVNGYQVVITATGRYVFSGSQNIASGQHLFNSEPVLNLVNNRWYLAFGDVDLGAGQAHTEIVDSVTGADISNTISFLPAGIASLAPFKIGNGPGATVGADGFPISGFGGYIDSLGIWPRVITAGEKTTLKNLSGGLPLGVDWATIASGSLADATEWWDFDQRSGSLITAGNAQGTGLTTAGGVSVGPPRLM